MFSLIKKHLLPLSVLLIAILPASYFMLKSGIYWNMHDDMQIIRQVEFEKCLKDGQIPCRWTPDLGYGYGYPLFNFYPPLPYIIGQILRILPIAYITTVKYTAFFQIILAAFFMYLLSRQFLNRYLAILPSLVFTYAPYHAVNIYVRGAMNEAWASVFFPLIFLFSYRIIRKPNLLNILMLSLSISSLLLSHNPMAMIFSPFVIVWSLFWTYYYRRLPLKHLIFSGLLSLGISSFFTIPVLAETNLVQVETMFQNYYHYSVHFVSFFQLFFSNYWGDGPSVWGTDDQMSFAVGFFQWIVPVLFSVYFLIKFIVTKRLSKNIIFFYLIFLFAMVSTFLTHERSTFIYQILPFIQKIQFPWRFLNLSFFFFSVSFIFLLRHLSYQFGRKPILILSTIFSVLLILFNYSKFYPVTSGPITDEQKLSGKAYTNLVTSGIYDYLPKTAQKAALAPANDYIDQISPPNTLYNLYSAKKGTDWQFFNITLSQPAVITLPVLYFPDFKIFDRQQPLPFTIEPEFGRIVISLTPGDHQLYIKLFNTPVRTISNYISFISLIIFFLLSIKVLWNRHSIQK